VKSSLTNGSTTSVELAFEAIARGTPEAVAVIFEDEQLTYRELNERADRLADHLRSLDVGADAVVGICVERSFELVISLLGVLKVGAAYMPISPNFPLDRIRWMLDESAAVAVLCAGPPPKVVTDIAAVVVRLDQTQGWATPLTAAVPRSIHPAALAYIIYTSGSTGRPKGVMVTRGGLSAQLDWMQAEYRLQPIDRVLQLTSAIFDFSVVEIFWPLMIGAAVVMPRPGGELEPRYLVSLSERHAVTVVNFVPSMLRVVLDTSTASPWRTIKLVFCGGDTLSIGVARSSRTIFPHAELHNQYGPTETTINATAWRYQPDDTTVPIGRAVAGTTLHVLDKQLAPVPRGSVGELWIGGIQLARGYVSRPGLTAERFVPDPFARQPGERCYRTGDLVRQRNDGVFEYVGRSDSQVKVRGFRIELGEIERAIEAHRSVNAAAVIARDDDVRGKVLVAFVCLATPATHDDLRGSVAERLPTHMVPSSFVTLDRLPLTPGGKLDRTALLTLPVLALTNDSRFEAPRSPTETVLAEIWARVLDVEQVGVRDNFFELGGQSLLVMRLVARIRAELSVEIAAQTVFECPTIVEQAEHIDALSRIHPSINAAAALIRRNVERHPLSFSQQRLWFLEAMGEGGASYHVDFALSLRGTLDSGALEAAFADLIARHDGLRTSFEVHEGTAFQRIHAVAELPLERRHATSLDEAYRWLANGVSRPFDLERGPCWRALLVEIADGHHLLALALHHLICDGGSTGILVRDLATAYQARRAGDAPAWRRLPFRYVDYAARQREASTLGAEDLQYWRDLMADAPPLLVLPTDRPRPARRSGRGSIVEFRLDPTLSAGVRARARHEQATVFSVLLAAMQAVVARWSRQSDVILGTGVAMRDDHELEEVVGDFVNLLPIRLQLAGDPTLRELISRDRELTRELIAHNRVPFERIANALRLRRDPSYTPVVQVVFTFNGDAFVAPDLAGLTVTRVELQNPAAAFDLTLRVEEEPNTFVGTWGYATDLFDRATIASAHAAWEDTLKKIVDDPSVPLSTAPLPVVTPKSPRVRPSIAAMQPKIVRADDQLVELQPLRVDSALPLVVSPRVPELALSGWLSSQRDAVEPLLHRHGALLFRGFGLREIADFEAAATAVCGELYGENGELPRTSAGRGVYTPVKYPREKMILWHNENTFADHWPMKIMFYCKRPADSGGETPVVDARRVYDLLSRELRAEFERKGVMYVRHYGGGMGLDWEQVFQTNDRDPLEARLRSTGVQFEWTANGRLRTRAVRPAITQHPRTGAKVFIAQVAHWHVAFLDPDVREPLQAQYALEDMPRHCWFGDGTPISEAQVRELERVYRAVEISFPWQTGDLMLVDNMLTGHARKPYEGDRTIFVAMGDIFYARELPAIGATG
jgi:amino acid adenylation domain-containing protein